MKPWHLRFSSEGRHPLFPDERSRRAAVRRLVRLAGPELIGFGIADDHAHVNPYCDRRRAGILLRTLRVTLQTVAEVRIEEAYLKPVSTRRHQIWLVDYLLEQVGHHGLPAHPATWSGTVFQDLVGARVIGDFVPRVRDALPRYELSSAWRAVGLPPSRLEPAPDQRIRELGAFKLVDAAASAVCADPDLEGNPAEVVLARAAACQLGIECGLPSSELAAALQVTERATRRSGSRDVPEDVLRAVRLTLALEALAARYPKTPK